MRRGLVRLATIAGLAWAPAASLAWSPAKAQTIPSPQPQDPASLPGGAVGETIAQPPSLPTPAQPRVEPSLETAGYAQRPGPDCADFQAAPGAGWRATASVRFPGPQGEVRIAAGQVLEPGGYVGGLDLAAILQARYL